MDRRKTLMQFVKQAKKSLNFESSLPALQYGLLLSVVVYTTILLTSRLFVFPYYQNVAFYSGTSVIILTFFYIWWNRVKDHDALIRLDSFYPHNELLTALSFTEQSNPLVDSILKRAQKASVDSFNQFKQRKKRIWRPKVLIALLLMMVVIGVLYIFPSQTQTEAVVIEKENEIIDELKKDVAEMEKKTTNEEIKKQLQDLQKKLAELNSSEEALSEVVKKQKELKLQEQKLQEKKDLKNKGENGAHDLTASEEEQLQALQQLRNALANSASATQAALSRIGKSIRFDLQNAIAQESSSDSAGDSISGENQGNSDEQNESSGQQTNQNGEGSGNNQSGSNGLQGEGSNGSPGQGSSGQGSGPGIGNGAGVGQGTKNLLSIPGRIGENGETIVDGGPLGEGIPVGEQEGPVPVTEGTIRPYEEVIGQYKDRYMESSERMQLPKDLQTIVQSYFSSIESE
ncbi:hypothetical protein [Ureibacillus manganicus]|uniref:Uncharacterized protein n=1 Tax=Ureibacillus manganicus DSM 26584 TaxID=1384049 RepID=A0A0A3HXY3_9BACL|nr:hypothetical protein [Ureibacillus manganicus]KGR75233.1 hypothetical protein CD29_18095 [Ureibacillus manganicus DSM 26584]